MKTYPTIVDHEHNNAGSTTIVDFSSEKEAEDNDCDRYTCLIITSTYYCSDTMVQLGKKNTFVMTATSEDDDEENTSER